MLTQGLPYVNKCTTSLPSYLIISDRTSSSTQEYRCTSRISFPHLSFRMCQVQTPEAPHTAPPTTIIHSLCFNYLAVSHCRLSKILRRLFDDVRRIPHYPGYIIPLHRSPVICIRIFLHQYDLCSCCIDHDIHKTAPRFMMYKVFLDICFDKRSSKNNLPQRT